MSPRTACQGLLALAVLLASSCEQVPQRYRWTKVLLTEGTGAVVGMATGRDGTLVGITDGPLIAFDGERFSRLDPAWPGKGAPWVRIDDRGTLYAQGFRLTKGAVAWEDIDIPGAPIPPGESPVGASDGGMYAYGQTGDVGRIYYRAPGASQWQPVGPQVFPLKKNGHLRMFADSLGAVWIEGEQRLYVGRGADLHYVLPSDGLSGVLDDGSLVYGEENYKKNFGEVVVRSEDGTERMRTLGYQCTQVNEEPCPTASLGGVAGFVSGMQVAPSGDVYSMWARQNGDWPILMRQRRDRDGWQPVWQATDPFMESAGLVIFAVDAKNQVWAMTNDQIAVIDKETGSTINVMTAATWRLDPE